jgi:hypothetical protein
MAEYKEIKGFQVQTRSSDPVPYAQELADNPYVGSWASGGDLNSSRRLLAASGVSNSSGLVFGGRTPAPAKTGVTEQYNGTSWTEVADLDQARDYIVGAGTATAALAIGGSTSTSTTAGYTENWNGSAWTEVNALTRGPSSPQSTTYGAASGSNTSALFYASDEGGNANARTESWDGTNWTEVNDQNTARSYGVGVGTSNSAALLIGGLGSPSNPGFIANVEEWNGSSWTEIADINTVRIQASGAMQGTTESTLFFGGRTPPATSSALTENWDGTSWTEVADLATARRGSGGSGVATSAFMAGGQTGPTGSVATTEEWAFSGVQPTDAASYSDAIIGDFYYNSSSGQFKNSVNGVTAGTWGSGGDMNTARYRMFGGFAPYSEGLVAGGQAPAKANVENYNGTSWTEVADIPTAMGDSGMIGVYTAGALAGGEPASGTSNEALHWNGSAWTEATNMPVGLERCSGSGSLTAGMITGGRNPSSPGGAATNLEYDGTNWTTGGSIPVGTYNIATQGPQTSAIAAGGVQTGAGSGSTAAYTYNGSAWTAVSSLNTATYESGWSTQGDGATRALIFGGNDAPARPTTQFWDGTSWTELNDLSSGRAAGGSFGGVNNAVYAGGSPPTVATTEEWSASDFLNKTVTTS